jgi:hypothetical protein
MMLGGASTSMDHNMDARKPTGDKLMARATGQPIDWDK